MTIEQALRDLLVLARREGWYADKEKQGAYAAALKALEEVKVKPKPAKAKPTKTKSKGKK